MSDPRNIGIVVLLTVVVGLSLSVRSARNELVTLKETVAASTATAAAEHARIEREQARVDAETVAGWAAAVAYWRSHGGVRVRTKAGQGALPALPHAADGVARLPAREPRSGAPVDVDAAECEARLNGSVLDALWIVSVKEWIRKQHEGSVQ